MKTINKQFTTYTSLLTIFILLFLVPAVSNAQVTTLVSDSLGLSGDNFSGYFNNLFNTALILGAVLAVLVIATAGLQYMTTEAVYGKGNSKERIWGAVLGVLMLLGIWIFFQEVNPNILNINLDLKTTVLQVTGPPPDDSNTEPPVQIVATEVVCGEVGLLSCKKVSEMCQGTPGFKTVAWPNQNTVGCFIEDDPNNNNEATFNTAMEVELTNTLKSYDGCSSNDELNCFKDLITNYRFWSNPKDMGADDGIFVFFENENNCIKFSESVSSYGSCTKNGGVAVGEVSAVEWQNNIKNTNIQLKFIPSP